MNDGFRSAPPSRGRVSAAAALLLLLAFLPYVPSLKSPLLYDDYGQILENPHLQELDNLWPVLRGRTLSDTDVLNGRRPLVLASYFLNYEMADRDPARWRIVNVAAHALTALVLFFVWLRLGRMTRFPGALAVAAGAALLFALAPASSEAVQVVSFRADVFCTLFLGLYLLGILLAAEPGVRGRWGLVLAGLSLVLALGAKETALAAPALPLALWLFFPETRPDRRRIGLISGGSVVLVVLYVAACAAGESFQGATGHWNGRTLLPPSNLLTLPWILLRSILVLAWPDPLILDRVVDPVAGVGDPRFWAGLLGLLLLAAALGAAWFRRRRWVGLALCWALLLYVPASNLLPLFNPVADRYLYGPTAAWSLLASLLLLGGTCCAGRLRRTRAALFGGLALAWALLLMLRLADYRSERLLWERTLADEPRSARAEVWLGLDDMREQRLDEAERRFRRALALNPEEMSAWTNLGTLLAARGAFDEAEALLLKALAKRPDKLSLHWNLCKIYQHRQDFRKALHHAEETLRIDPAHPRARQIVDYFTQHPIPEEVQ